MAGPFGGIDNWLTDKAKKKIQHKIDDIVLAFREQESEEQIGHVKKAILGLIVLYSADYLIEGGKKQTLVKWAAKKLIHGGAQLGAVDHAFTPGNLGPDGKFHTVPGGDEPLRTDREIWILQHQAAAREALAKLQLGVSVDEQLKQANKRLALYLGGLQHLKAIQDGVVVKTKSEDFAGGSLDPDFDLALVAALRGAKAIELSAELIAEVATLGNGTGGQFPSWERDP